MGHRIREPGWCWMPRARLGSGADSPPPDKSVTIDAADPASTAAACERRRSVPKKEQPPSVILPTRTLSLLPYNKSSMRRQWSSGSDLGGAASFCGCEVLKFGGSSCGNRLGQVIELIERKKSSGTEPVAVVVSAMGKSTDRLIDAADAACAGRTDDAERFVGEVQRICMSNIEEHAAGDVSNASAVVDALLAELRQLLLGISLVAELSPATLDRLLSFGERLSANVLACLLTARGRPAHAVDGADWLITNGEHGNAKVEWVHTQERLGVLVASWPFGSIPVVTGFLGATAEGRRTTLGRNGSDYTAALLGLGLGAARVVINTDVPGVFTADPRLVKDAYPVPELSYVEAMELAISGSRIFHPRTILPLVEQGIPMVIRDTNRPDGPGTTICSSPRPGAGAATCVTTLENLEMLAVRTLTGSVQHIGVRVVASLTAAGITIHYAHFAVNGQAVHVVVKRDDQRGAQEALKQEFAQEIALRELDEMTAVQPVSLLTLVRASRAGILTKFVSALAAARVKVRSVGQASNSTSFSCVIDGDQTAVAVRCAHTAIDLSHQVVSLLVLGNNETSRGLLQRIAAMRGELQQHKVELRVVGVMHTCASMGHNSHILQPDGTVKLHEWGEDPEALVKKLLSPAELCAEHPKAAGSMLGCVPVSVLERLRQMSGPVVVDCTRTELPNAAFYRACADLGIHVVVSNSASIARLGRDELPELGRESFLSYDSCVGASVPISSTLQSLHQMGDPVVSVEASLSGTCGYVISRVMDGVPFSEAVEDAMQRGYTECDPSVDLDGTDFARKLRVMARQMGHWLRAEDIDRAPLVPASCLQQLRAAGSHDERVAVLRSVDAEIRNEAEASLARGERLAFVGELEVAAGQPRASIRRQSVPAGHAAHALRGEEVYVSLRCHGRDREALKLNGPGCGSASALGVFGDIMKTVRHLQGDEPARVTSQ